MSLKQIARDVLAILERGTYVSQGGTEVRIAEAQGDAVAGTRLYTPEHMSTLTSGAGRSGPAAHVTITDETTQVAAGRLVVDEGCQRLVLLNFASARNHGGGFLNGASAQEEDLCRCSGLFPTLLADPVQPYYEANRAHRSLLYTDHIIYSPDVPWFRTSSRAELLERFFVASVITAPAPNAGPLLRAFPEAGPSIRDTFRRRWSNVLAVAAAQGHRTALLGAWGCGAFQNDPDVAAETLAESLADERFTGDFDTIVVAIPNRGAQGTRNHDAFVRALGR